MCRFRLGLVSSGTAGSEAWANRVGFTGALKVVDLPDDLLSGNTGGGCPPGTAPELPMAPSTTGVVTSTSAEGSGSSSRSDGPVVSVPPAPDWAQVNLSLEVKY